MLRRQRRRMAFQRVKWLHSYFKTHSTSTICIAATHDQCPSTQTQVSDFDVECALNQRETTDLENRVSELEEKLDSALKRIDTLLSYRGVKETETEIV